VQEEPREGNGDRCERRPAADQPHGRAPTPPARDNNRRANEGANVDANAPPLFRWAFQNLALRPCCCAAAQRQRPPRNDGCTNS
jgi:hypothetical protein